MHVSPGFLAAAGARQQYNSLKRKVEGSLDPVAKLKRGVKGLMRQVREHVQRRCDQAFKAALPGERSRFAGKLLKEILPQVQERHNTSRGYTGIVNQEWLRQRCSELQELMKRFSDLDSRSFKAEVALFSCAAASSYLRCLCAAVPLCCCASVMMCLCAAVPLCCCHSVLLYLFSSVPVCCRDHLLTCLCAAVPLYCCAHVQFCLCAAVRLCCCASVPLCP